MSRGKTKPETVSVRIREDDYATIREISKHYGVKHVDAIQKLLDIWSMLDEDDRDMIFMGGDIEKHDPVIAEPESEAKEFFQVTYNKR